MSTLYHATQQSSIPTVPGIYKITCVANGRIYIGSTSNLRTRYRCHFADLRHNKHSNPKLQRAWNKYGTDAFTFEILEYILLPELLTAREQWWFDKLRPFGKRGFNIAPTAGSNLGRECSPETKEVLRLKSLGRKASEEAKRHMGESHLGTKRSAETRTKMSASLFGNTRNLGKKRSPEVVEKTRLKNLGRPITETTRIAVIASNKRRKGEKKSSAAIEKTRLANLGRKNTPEAITGMIASRVKDMKTLIVTSPDGLEYTVTGIRQFCKEHSLDRSTLLRVAKGKYSHHKGWKARFPETDAG